MDKENIAHEEKFIIIKWNEEEDQENSSSVN
jgi:hypothetical protein